MKKAESGLFVSVDYTGTLDNGEVFDSSEGRQPMEIQMGSGTVIPGF
ncbi:MAG: FKBP-type peptidyl-prolyl cis-trans isomerase [Desulfosarcina sp.]|nr:FKBP-type peptidyl-prolyl cis-trans isomerase [Desulfosarcina sp.]